MSKKKIFRCQECGYETVIYEGRGFMGQHIEAMSCADCRNIVPLVVGGVIGDAAPSFNSLVGRLCLRCGSDRIHRWDMHTCPKCVGKMQLQRFSSVIPQSSKPFPSSSSSMPRPITFRLSALNGSRYLLSKICRMAAFLPPLFFSFSSIT